MQKKMLYKIIFGNYITIFFFHLELKTILILHSNLAVLINRSLSNIVQNGDFDSGDISPWSCNQVHCEVFQNYLTLTKRTETWAGPRQLINGSNFITDENIQSTFSFDIQSNEEINAMWKMKISKDGETNYHPIIRCFQNIF